MGGISAVGGAGSLVMLNETWYKDYPRSSFHTFNDSREWQQVDKVGHAWTAYNLGLGLTKAWRWAGVSHQTSVLLGSLSGFGYLGVIEWMDAHSQKWGWSWADLGANTLGTALFAAQELAWSDQRLQFKFSAHSTNYGELTERANDLFGRGIPTRILKDYNAQTYWLSFNARSFFPEARLPQWLNISVGYGASGMFGGFENIAYDKDGSVTFSRTDIKRYRQWYLSPDIDLTKIKTNHKALKTAFTVLNILKIPAPTLELSNGKLKGHWFYF